MDYNNSAYGFSVYHQASSYPNLPFITIPTMITSERILKVTAGKQHYITDGFTRRNKVNNYKVACQYLF